MSARACAAFSSALLTSRVIMGRGGGARASSSSSARAPSRASPSVSSSSGGLGEVEGRSRPSRAASDDLPRAPHPSLTIVLPMPPAIDGDDDDGDVFDDVLLGGEIRAGMHFNRAAMGPVRACRFLEDERAWDGVARFVRALARGTRCLSDLSPAAARGAGATNVTDDASPLQPAGVCRGVGVGQDGVRLDAHPPTRRGKKPRHTYKAAVAYYGPAFAGWAWLPSDGATDALFRAPDDERGGGAGGGGAEWTPGAHSVVATMQRALNPLFAGDKERPIQCAGRTDKGVSALAQTVSFWTLNDLDPAEIVAAVNEGSPAGRAGALRCVLYADPHTTASAW